MQQLANISVFEGMMNGVRCSSIGIFNETVTVWTSPSIGYNVVKTDDGKFEVWYSIQGQDTTVIGIFDDAQSAIATAKECYQDK